MPAGWTERATRRQQIMGLKYYRPLLGLVVLIGTALVVAQLLLLDRLHPLPYQLPIGSWPDQLYVQRFYEREGDQPDQYRWSTEGSTLLLRQVGTSSGAAITLRLGERPTTSEAPQLGLLFGGREFARVPIEYGPRSYHLLAPRWGLRGGNLELGLTSNLFSTPDDPRRLGLRVDHVSLDFAATAPVLPAPRQVLEQFALLALAGLTLRRLRWSTFVCAAVLALLALGLLFVYSRYLPLLDHYMGRILVGGAFIAALAWWLPARLARWVPWAGPVTFAAQLTTVMALACAIRLAGALFPMFGAHDLPRNIGRFLLVHGGDLVIVARSAEFGGGFTVYPPSAYVVLMPLGLLMSNVGLIVQGSLALLDGISALLIGLLARKLGTSPRAALLAALLYAALPIALTGLWWGFTAQSFGQWTMAPIALLLLLGFERRSPWPWIGATTLLAIALLSHIGVTILAVGWLGLALLALLTRRWAAPRARWWFLTVFVLGCTLGFFLIYWDVAAIKIQQALQIGGKVADEPFGATYSLIWKGLLISFSPLGLALIPLGLLLLRRRLDNPGALLIWSWLATVLLFFAVELLSGLQARYIYFFMPLGCIAIAVLLDRLAARGQWGWGVAWSLAVLLTVQGALLWYSGTFEEIKLSITPLSH